MFGLFSRDENICPIPENTRKWIDLVFIWFFDSFDKQKIADRKILTPHHSDFPIVYNGSEENAMDTLRIVSKQMDVSLDTIQLDFYQQGVSEISAGGVFGNRYFLQKYDEDKFSAGLYEGADENGKYHISLEVKKLKEPEKMVATLAHEVAHIKLLGEGRIIENDERLTDLTTVIFGLGIFNANAAFQYGHGYGSWSTSKQGYLSQMEWGYALALFSFIRHENNPSWLNFLTRNVKSDYNKSMKFILENEDIVLNKDYASKKE